MTDDRPRKPAEPKSPPAPSPSLPESPTPPHGDPLADQTGDPRDAGGAATRAPGEGRTARPASNKSTKAGGIPGEGSPKTARPVGGSAAKRPARPAAKSVAKPASRPSRKSPAKKVDAGTDDSPYADPDESPAVSHSPTPPRAEEPLGQPVADRAIRAAYEAVEAHAGGKDVRGRASGAGRATTAGPQGRGGSGAPDPRPATPDVVQNGAPDSPPATPDVVRRTAPPLDVLDRQRLCEGRHSSPHSVLGAHPIHAHGVDGVVVRARQPDAIRGEVVFADGRVVAMDYEGDGLFSVLVPAEPFPVRYRLRFHFADGNVWERDDAYRFLPTIGDVDLHLFGEGTHRRLWTKLGAHPMVHDGVAGTAFAVWAPNAQRVSVVGQFNGWDGRIHPMRIMGSSGVWELFLPEIEPGALYRYEIVTREGHLRVKTDPFAFKLEQSPGTASIVQRTDSYRWKDDAWMNGRPSRDLTREPMSVYEVHLGSWMRCPEEGNRFLSYAEIAPKLADHCRRLGFTHVELLPVMEHPFYGSWGYQVSGYFAPTSRYGSPDDFRYLVDTLHQAGIGVILDWVPAHFPKDDFALRRFDGTALFEHEDPRLGEHPDWGTLIFNYGRNEVRNFLVANALYWLHEFHCDGLRVDAVASMLYLDYSRQPNEWVRNRYGGRENLDAIDFLKQLNTTIAEDAPGCVMIAEESTAWPDVTKPVAAGGLGFTFKWNMGWMHDTLAYFEKDPLYRRHHQDMLTFAMIYEHSERFVMPLSHDEVVHLKGSLLNKMPGDEWQKLANLRTLFAYQYTRPGKILLFMGSELAPWTEWDHDRSLDWHLEQEPARAGFMRFMQRLGNVYRRCPPLWRNDHNWEGFSWIDVSDRENSVLSFVRWDGMEHVVVVMNLTPVPREHYRIGAPTPGAYVPLLNSDDAEFGGSGYGHVTRVETEPSPFHGYAQSMSLTLPPLSTIVLARAEHAASWTR